MQIFDDFFVKHITVTNKQINRTYVYCLLFFQKNMLSIKKIFLFLVVCLIVWSFAQKNIEASRLPNNWQKTVEIAYKERKERISPDMLLSRLENIHTTIIERQQRSNETEMLIFLQFLEQLIKADILPDQELIETEIADQTDTKKDTEHEKNTTDRTKTGTIPWFTRWFKQANNVFLAWTKHQTIWVFDINASREPIHLTELSMITQKDIGSHIDTLYLVTSNWTIIGQQDTVHWSTVRISWIDTTIHPADPQTIYLVADLSPVWFSFLADEWISFTYTLRTTEAKGVFSQAQITHTTAQTDPLHITPVRIESIEINTDIFGQRVSDRLFSGQQPVMIFTITAAETTNQQRTTPRTAHLDLEQILVTVQDATHAWWVIDTLTIQRLDRQSQPIPVTTVKWTTAIFSWSSNDFLIPSWWSATYMIAATIPEPVHTSWESLTITLPTLQQTAFTRKEQTWTQSYSLIWNHLPQTFISSRLVR